MSPSSFAEPVVVIVNGDRATCLWVEATVTSAGLSVLSFNSYAQLLPHMKPGAIACAILDVTLPDACGLEVQTLLARAGVPTVFLTRERCFSACVKAVQRGALDYLIMPCNSLALVRVVRLALRQACMVRSQSAKIDDLRCRYERLTARERQVFALVSNGLRNKQIAHLLNISQVTVQIHRGQVMKKMAARSIASLVRMADALGSCENAKDAGASGPMAVTPCDSVNSRSKALTSRSDCASSR